MIHRAECVDGCDSQSFRERKGCRTIACASHCCPKRAATSLRETQSIGADHRCEECTFASLCCGEWIGLGIELNNPCRVFAPFLPTSGQATPELLRFGIAHLGTTRSGA